MAMLNMKYVVLLYLPNSYGENIKKEVNKMKIINYVNNGDKEEFEARGLEYEEVIEVQEFEMACFIRYACMHSDISKDVVEMYANISEQYCECNKDDFEVYNILGVDSYGTMGELLQEGNTKLYEKEFNAFYLVMSDTDSMYEWVVENGADISKEDFYQLLNLEKQYYSILGWREPIMCYDKCYKMILLVRKLVNVMDGCTSTYTLNLLG